MHNGLQKSAQGIANSSTILPYSEWITRDVYCPVLQWAKCFSSVWYQFALISSSILLFYYPNNENTALSSPPAQSNMIYQCPDTGWATKKKLQSLLAVLLQQIICFGSRKKVVKTEGHCLRIFFSILTLSLPWATIFDNWIHLAFFIPLIKNYYVNSHKCSSSTGILFFFCCFLVFGFFYNWEPANIEVHSC